MKKREGGVAVLIIAVAALLFGGWLLWDSKAHEGLGYVPVSDQQGGGHEILVCEEEYRSATSAFGGVLIAVGGFLVLIAVLPARS